MEPLPWILLGALIAVGVILFLRAVDSRKHYTCPECGEKQRVELMEASRCNTCGAPLKRT